MRLRYAFLFLLILFAGFSANALAGESSSTTTPVSPATSSSGGGAGMGCSDSDSGLNYNLKGVVSYSDGRIYTDYCKNSNILVEYSCGTMECVNIQDCSNTSSPQLTTNYGQLQVVYKTESLEAIIDNEPRGIIIAGLTTTLNASVSHSLIFKKEGYKSCEKNITLKSKEAIKISVLLTKDSSEDCILEISETSWIGGSSGSAPVCLTAKECKQKDTIKEYSCSFGCSEGACIAQTNIPPDSTKICGKLIYVYTSNFSGKSCPYCEMQTPVIKELEKNLNCLKVELVDAYSAPERANQLGVNGYPTMIFINEGCTKQKAGYTNYESLKDWIYYESCAISINTSNYGGNIGSCLENPTNYWDQETNKCYSGFSKDLAKKSCSDPDGGINKYQIAQTFGFRSYYADEKDKRIRTGGKDSCIGEKRIAENYCDENGFIQTTYLDCSNGCNKNGCIKGKEIKENTKCSFKNSKNNQECYLAGQFGPQDEGKFCKGNESCIIKVNAEEGEKITWKSTCGDYKYTLMDGNDEIIEFDCSGGKTNTTEIKDKGFRFAAWQCYDGKEEKRDDETCKPSKLWQTYAKESCDGHCSKESGKCGVNSFGVSRECYYEGVYGEAISVSLASITASIGCNTYLKECKTNNLQSCKEWELNCQEENAAIEEFAQAVICKDSCPSDGKCYPFGYRKSERYCTDSGTFIEQLKAENKCDNNFECSSNVCISGKCVSQGFIEKVISWFSKFFGRE